SLMMLKLCL
ncbi:tetratricopeptide repeat family protein, partial [Chlamydia psittaci C1/97]